MSLRRTLDVMGATVERASSFPLSASCLVNRAELLSLVERARAELPVELDEAAALLVAHQDVITRAEDEAEHLLVAARVRADEIIEQSALVVTARDRSDQILDAARAEAARLLRQADEYCDGRLEEFENDLERAMAQVRRGRDRLRERSDLASLDTLQAHGADADGLAGGDVEYVEYEEEYVEEYVAEYVEVEVFDGSAEDTPAPLPEQPEEPAQPEQPEEPVQPEQPAALAPESDPVPDPEVVPAWEPAGARQPVGVGAQREHRVVDVAAVERAEAERAGLGQRVNLQ